MSDYKAARGILAPTDEPAEVSISNARDEILKELSGAGISVSEVAERVKEMREIMSKDVENAAIGSLLTTIGDLIQSIEEFHKRYGTATRQNAVENQAKAFAQEGGEYIWAIAEGDKVKAAKEAADVLFTLIGVAILAGITWDELNDAMIAVANKNDEKTVENGWNWNARGTKVEKLTTGNGDAGSA